MHLTCHQERLHIKLMLFAVPTGHTAPQRTILGRYTTCSSNWFVFMDSTQTQQAEDRSHHLVCAPPDHSCRTNGDEWCGESSRRMLSWLPQHQELELFWLFSWRSGAYCNTLLSVLKPPQLCLPHLLHLLGLQCTTAAQQEPEAAVCTTCAWTIDINRLSFPVLIPQVQT